MKNAKMVRALKNKNFREQLSTTEQEQLGSRIGIAEIDDSMLLNTVAGGATVWGKSHYPTLCCACTL
jgi:hypothetical protein